MLIAPPLVPLAPDEQMKLKLEAITSDDRWIKKFIDRLADCYRE